MKISAIVACHDSYIMRKIPEYVLAGYVQRSRVARVFSLSSLRAFFMAPRRPDKTQDQDPGPHNIKE